MDFVMPFGRADDSSERGFCEGLQIRCPIEVICFFALQGTEADASQVRDGGLQGRLLRSTLSCGFEAEVEDLK